MEPLNTNHCPLKQLIPVLPSSFSFISETPSQRGQDRIEAMAMQKGDHREVLIRKTIAVHPSAAPHAHQPSLLQLSNLDRKCPLLMYLVFFYRSPPPSHKGLSANHSFFTSLKLGLEETLSAWYPAAGRLSPNPATGRLNLACCGSGALLVEAETQVQISELGDLSQYNDFFEDLVFKPPFNGSNFSEMPLVVAQVTRLGCGGYALGVGTNHSLFDGFAYFNFLRAWASKAAGREVGELELVHERGRLLVGDGGLQTLTQSVEKSAGADGKEKVTPRVIAFEHLHKLIEQLAVTSMGSIGSDEKLLGRNFSEMESTSQEQYFILKNFHVSSAMIGKLKKKASSGLGGCSCSSFEVLAAHLWKARTKALGIDKERMVCLQFTVDIRKRMVPSLPKGFTGNAFVLSSISCTSKELENQSLSSLIEKISEAKRSITDSYVIAYLEALEGPKSTIPFLPELTIVSDWRRTPFHEVDFGLGTAIYASPLAPPIQQVVYFMQNPVEMGGVDVRIGLLQEHVGTFSHYFLGVE